MRQMEYIMKVTFDKAKLLAALIPLSGISQVKNTLTNVEGLLFECPPVERYGKFEGDMDTTCRISAFDLEKGMQTTVDCDIEEQGIYVINSDCVDCGACEDGCPVGAIKAE